MVHLNRCAVDESAAAEEGILLDTHQDAGAVSWSECPQTIFSRPDEFFVRANDFTKRHRVYVMHHDASNPPVRRFL